MGLLRERAREEVVAMSEVQEPGSGPHSFLSFVPGTLAIIALGALLAAVATDVDAAPLPGSKVCSDPGQCSLLRKPDRRILPAGVMFARVGWVDVASDGAKGAKAKKAAREAKRDARNEKRAAKRSKRKAASS